MLGISPDTPKAQLKFKEKYDLPYTLLADDKKEVAKKFDVLKEKNMYGRTYMGVERSTFLVDAGGVVRAEWRKVSVPGHADEVKKALQGL